MSSIDNRIVQMQFENSQFEKGVKQSLKSIEELEKSLEFKDAEKSLSSLQKAGDSFSLASMANGIEKVSEKFSALSIIGKRVLENLTDTAMRMGESFVKSISVDQITAGFSKYETKTRSTKTIMEATGKDVDYVNERLEKLNRFTDETSYNFSDMVENIGKFTSMGIDLDTSVTAMEGIATWAALSGQGVAEASRAMYNLSQAIGVGSVKLMDWKSIENANMATKEFKQTVIEIAKSMGKLNAQSKTAKGTLVNFENFSQTLSEGWFTKDVLLKALDEYGSAANKIIEYMDTHEIYSVSKAIEQMGLDLDDLGVRAFLAAQESRTFKDSIDATKDAVSTGWMKTFEYVFGNVDQATKLWTEFTEVLYEVFAAGAETRNSILKEWSSSEVGGREDLVRGFMDVLWGLVAVLNSVKEAFKDIFLPGTEEDFVGFLKTASITIKEFGASFRAAVEPIEILTGEFEELERVIPANPFEPFEKSLQRGARSDEVKKLQERLMELEYDLPNFGADGIFGPETKAALEAFQRDAGLTVDGIYDEATHKALGKAMGFSDKDVTVIDTVEKKIEELPPQAQKYKDILMGVFSSFHIIGQILGTAFKIVTHFISLLSPFGDVLLAIGSAIGQSITAFDKWLKEAGVFDKWFEDAKKFLEPFGEWVKKAADSLLSFFGLSGETNGEIFTFAKLYENVKNSIKKTGIIDKLSKAWENFKNAFKNLGTTLKKNWKTVKETLGERFQSFLASLPDKIASVTEWFGNLATDGVNLVSSFIEKIPGAIEKIKGFWAALTQKGDSDKNQAPGFLTRVKDAFTSVVDFLFGEGDIANGKKPGLFRKIGQLISGDLDGFTEGMDDNTKKQVLDRIQGVKDFLQKIREAIVVLFGGQLADDKKISDETVQKIEQFKSSIASVFEGIALLFTGKVQENSKLSKDAQDKIIAVRNTIEGVIKLIGSTLTSLWNTIVGIFTGEVTFDSVGEFFSSFWESVKQFFTDAFGIASMNLGNAWDTVSKFFSGLWENIKSIGKWAIIAYGVYKAGSVLGNISDSFKELSKTIKSYSKNTQPLSKTVLEFAAAIALIAGSIWLIGQLSPEQFQRGVIAVGGIVAAIGAFLLLSSFFSKEKAKTINNIGNAIWDFGKAIGVLAVTVVVLSLIPWKTFFNGLAKVGILCFLMVKVIKKLNKAGATSLKMAGLMGLAAAVGILALIVGLIGHYKWETIGKGLVGLYGIVFILRGLFKMLGKFGAKKLKLKGLLSLTLLIGVMAIVVAELGKLDSKTLLKGLGSLYIIGTVLKRIFKSLSGIQAPNIGAVITSMVVLGLAMAGLVVALQYVKDVDFKVILAFSVGLSALVTAIGLMAKLSAGATFSGVSAAALGLLEIIAVISVVIAAFAGLNQIPGFKEFMESGAEVIGSVLGTLAAAFAGSFDANGMKAFGDGMDSLTSLPEADPEGVQNAIDQATLLQKFSEGLPGKDIVTKVVDFLFGSEFKQFSGDMAAFGVGFNNFAEQLNAVEIWEGLEEKTASAITIAEAINSFSTTLPNKESITKIVDSIFGSELSQFSGDMASFGTGFNNFASQINDIDSWTGLEDKTNIAISIAEAINAFSGTLPEKDNVSKIVDSIFGSELSQFSGDMASFGTGFNNFASQINAIDSWTGLEDKATSAVEIAGYIRDFGKSLPQQSTIDRVVNTIFKSEFKQFNEDMPEFAAAFNNFSTEMAKVDYSSQLETDTKNAVKIAEQVAEFISSLNGMSIDTQNSGILGWFQDDTKQDTVFDAIGTLAASIKNSQDAFSGLSEGTLIDDVKAAITAATRMAAFLNYISSDDFNVEKDATRWNDALPTSTFDVLKEDLIQLGTAIQEFSTNVTGIDLPAVSGAITSVTDFLRLITEGPEDFTTNGILSFLNEENIASDLATIITSISTQFSNAGVELASYLSAGISDGSLTIGIAALMVKSLATLDSYKKSFATIGKNFVAGLTVGIAANASLAVNAAFNVGRRMVEAAARAIRSASPSKETMKLGNYFTEGLAIGTADKTSEATNAASEVANSMLATASGTLSSLSSLLAEDIDVNPVIAPVVDLTNARQSAALIGGLFGNPSMAVTSSVLATNAMGSTNNGRPITIQNGTMSTSESFDGVTDKLNSLAEYLTARNDGPKLDEMTYLSEKFGDLAEAVTNLKIVLDTGTLVGELTPALDTGFGTLASRRDRGN